MTYECQGIMIIIIILWKLSLSKALTKDMRVNVHMHTCIHACTHNLQQS